MPTICQHCLDAVWRGCQSMCVLRGQKFHKISKCLAQNQRRSSHRFLSRGNFSGNWSILEITQHGHPRVPVGADPGPESLIYILVSGGNGLELVAFSQDSLSFVCLSARPRKSAASDSKVLKMLHLLSRSQKRLITGRVTGELLLNYWLGMTLPRDYRGSLSRRGSWGTWHVMAGAQDGKWNGMTLHRPVSSSSPNYAFLPFFFGISASILRGMALFCPSSIWCFYGKSFMCVFHLFYSFLFFSDLLLNLSFFVTSIHVFFLSFLFLRSYLIDGFPSTFHSS